MSTTEAEVDSLRAEALEALARAGNEAEQEAWRANWLGRKDGRLTLRLRGLKDAAPEQRAALGKSLNQLKTTLEYELEARRESARADALAALSADAALDVSLPGRPQSLGRLHPVTQTMNDCIDAFAEMGFRVFEGPEVEWSRYNFDAVRIPDDHPARDMWDTIWIDTLIEGERQLLLRTHTSPNQIRVMEQSEPPVRVIVPGKCYRQEATDATHEWMLTQIEGLAVDEGVRMSDLKGTLYAFAQEPAAPPEEWIPPKWGARAGEGGARMAALKAPLSPFARRIFGGDRQIIFHHSYFPFVEPGVEMAIDCFICRADGSDCRTCQGTGWIEILGAGMVHPEIIENAGYDSSKYTGFAFGVGIERVAMLRWGIEDIRHFYQNDLRFLRQF